MYLLKFSALLLATTVLFSSCSLMGGLQKLGDNSKSIGFAMESLDKKSDIIFEEILNAINNRDSDEIKGMLSKTALAEETDIDSSIEYLFNLFDGEVVSWERDSLSADESSRENGYSRMIRTWYTVNTENSKYLFLILNYDKNSIDPDLKGIYTLHGIDEADENALWDNWFGLQIPGVYMIGD